MNPAAWVVRSVGFLCVCISASRAAEPLEKYVPTAEELRQGYRGGQRPGPAGRVYKDRLTPHWFAGNTRFWYRNDLRGGTKEFILVDAENGKRDFAFDHKKRAESLSKAAEKEYKPDRMPFNSIEFVEESKAVQCQVADVVWK